MKDYLFVAGAPTPNGRLHLGHIGAQFLKLDLLKRHARREGARAGLCVSMDAFDPTIHILAQQQGITEAEFCQPYVDGITEDLRNAAISYEVFLDTSTDEGKEVIAETVVGLDSLVTPNKVVVSEKAAVSTRTGKPLVGRLLLGECPNCGRTMRGESCDPCGMVLPLEKILDVRPADPEDSLEWQQVDNHFLSVPTQRIRDYIDTLPMPAVTRRKADEIVATLLTDNEFRTRWTASAPYGITTGVPGQVYFNHVLVTLAEQITYGEIARRRCGLGANPFEIGANAITVGAYGADNLGVFLVNNVALALATERYRPFHHQLVSEFYTNGGQKISTSRSDALWIADVAKVPGFSRDGMRGYLLSVAAPDVEVDVSMAEMGRFMESLNGRLHRIAAIASRFRPPRVDHPVLADAEASIADQSAALKLSHVDQPRMWRTVDEWIDRTLASDAERRYSTLAAFAVIAAPALPDIANTVWSLLARGGRPDLRSLRKLAGYDY
jgi:methionyl-tRNA synthetase